MTTNKIKLTTNPYKGTRDFYPEEMRIRNQIFNKLFQLVELFGYEPYDGPMLELFDVYAAKTGEEIVSEQLYSFEDRGGRRVAMRPEMTPTLARMVAKRARELPKPIRWYSLPNLWRYESPQKGRLREHWQLNLDIFGIDDAEAEIEVMTIAIELLRVLGADESCFELKYNHRSLMNSLFRQVLKLADEDMQKVSKIIDKKNKVSPAEFDAMLGGIGISAERTALLNNFFAIDFERIPQEYPELGNSWEILSKVKASLEKLGYAKYIRFSPDIIRGFDYYTGTVFEVFDKNPENRRSLFGGGRYDNLVELFGVSGICGVGFGMGDVTLFDFLAVHSLLPQPHRGDLVLLAILPDMDNKDIHQLAQKMRANGIATEVPWGISKLGKQLQSAEKKGIRYAVIQGSEERKKGQVLIKDLKEGQQAEVLEDEAYLYLKNKFGKG